MSVPDMETRQALNELYEECMKCIRERDQSMYELFRSVVECPIEGGYVKKPIIIVTCRVLSGIKAPYKPHKSQLGVFIKLYGLDKLYTKERAEHLDRIFLRCIDPIENVKKPFISGHAVKASLPISQWVFRYTISHLFLEGVKLVEKDSEEKITTNDYVGIRMPHGTECFEYAPAESEAKFYIYPDPKFWTYALKNMNVEYLRDLLKEAPIIYTIFSKLIQYRELRQVAIGSMSRGFGTVEITGISVIVQNIPIEPIEWIRNVVNRLSTLKQMPKTKTEEKVKKQEKAQPQQVQEQKQPQQQQAQSKLSISDVAKFIRQMHG